MSGFSTDRLVSGPAQARTERPRDADAASKRKFDRHAAARAWRKPFIAEFVWRQHLRVEPADARRYFIAAAASCEHEWELAELIDRVLREWPVTASELGEGGLLRLACPRYFRKPMKNERFARILGVTRAELFAIANSLQRPVPPELLDEHKAPSPRLVAVLAGRPPTSQKGWLKTLRHWIAFAIAEGECKDDPTIGIKTTKPLKSSGYLTWGDVQIEQYRERHKIGPVARLALELMLNIAARRHDAHLIGHQHLRNGYLSWRPSKASQTTGKMLTIRVMPELQAALDAMPRSDALTFLLTEYGRPFTSAAAFGNKFADWCKAAGLEPKVCDDGKVRNYRAHGLRKAALVELARNDCTAPEIMAVSGHATLSEVQKYIVAVEQARMAEAAMVKRIAGTRQAQT